VLARQAAAAVGVGTCWPWETAATHCRLLGGAKRFGAILGEERGGGILWRPPARLQLVDLGGVVRLRLDVAVGAFINEAVLLLRTRPTHSVSADIEFGRPDIQWQRPNCPQPVVRALSVAAGDRAFCLPFTVVFNYSAPAEDPSHHGRLVALYNFT